MQLYFVSIITSICCAIASAACKRAGLPGRTLLPFAHTLLLFCSQAWSCEGAFGMLNKRQCFLASHVHRVSYMLLLHACSCVWAWHRYAVVWQEKRGGEARGLQGQMPLGEKGERGEPSSCIGNRQRQGMQMMSHHLRAFSLCSSL